MAKHNELQKILSNNMSETAKKILFDLFRGFKLKIKTGEVEIKRPLILWISGLFCTRGGNAIY